MIDKAERLLNIITRLLEASHYNDVIDNRSVTYENMPLYEGLPIIISHSGLGNYSTMLDHFNSLCSGIKSDIESISNIKESVKSSWFNCIESISAVFQPTNFGLQCFKVFDEHFSDYNMDLLDTISDRLQNSKVFESSDKDLLDALDAVRDALTFLEGNDQIDKRIIRILKHYLEQLETIYTQVKDFGDDVFWHMYKETYATFLQHHQIIAEGIDNKEDYVNRVQAIWNSLAIKAAATLSVGANIATLTEFIKPLISG